MVCKPRSAHVSPQLRFHSCSLENSPWCLCFLLLGLKLVTWVVKIRRSNGTQKGNEGRNPQANKQKANLDERPQNKADLDERHQNKADLDERPKGEADLGERSEDSCKTWPKTEEI